MSEDVRQALAIDASSTMEDRTIDITTTGRRSGAPRRIEIVFYRLGEDIYLSGIPRTHNPGTGWPTWLPDPSSRSTSNTASTPTCRRRPRSSATPRSADVSSPCSPRSSTAATAPTVHGPTRSSMSGWRSPLAKVTIADTG